MPSIDLAGMFQNPQRRYSPAPLWWWSGDKLERGRLRWQMERFVEGGVYNLIIMNLAPTGPLFGSDPDDPAFFSEDWWKIFAGVCEDAKELGIQIWFYDQIGFSGANLQGQLVTRENSFAGQSLDRIFVDLNGAGEVCCPTNGQPLAAFAVPLDDAGKAAGKPVSVAMLDGMAKWTGTGRQRLMIVYFVRRGFDYCQPAACAALMDMVHGEFERRVGRQFGSVIAGSFQDELPAMPTWGANFEESFRRRHGYELRVHLGALWEEYGAEADKVRRDYHQTRADLIETAFFKPLFHWHEKHKLICGFDQMGPVRAGYPVESVKVYADYLRTHRWFSAPGSDLHGDAKIHSSLAHLYDRPRVWIESFHSTGWGGTLEETFDWLLPWLRAGANLYNPHAAYYSTRGGWWEWAPPSTCWRQPYWRHYSTFATAVARLCEVLNQGDHVCDVAVLFPTTTVQAGVKLDGPTATAERAHQVYLDLTGELGMLRQHAGVLDKDGRDYDVLDDESIQRGQVQEERLTIGRESYRAIVLPACELLEDATAKRLQEFVESDGLLVAVSVAPKGLKCVLAATVEDVPAALQKLTKRVEAPVPTLWRKVGERDVLFLQATCPTASTMGGTGKWPKVHYLFDGSRYVKSMVITVRGVKGMPKLWDPFTGEQRTLPTVKKADGLEVTVDFSTEPMALIVFDEEPAEPAKSQTSGQTKLLEGAWDVELVSTIDNRFGDFAKPDHVGTPVVQQWEFQHRMEPGDSDGIELGWHQVNFTDSKWAKVHATFGPHGQMAGPDLEEWKPAVYSVSRGIWKDVLHWNNLGPHAHVPEEFLDFGELKKGQVVKFRTTIHAEQSGDFHLAIGAAARKEAWWNGEKLPECGPGYAWLTPVALKAGANSLEFHLHAEHEPTRLRAYFAVVRDVEKFRRPESLTSADEPQKETTLGFAREMTVDFAVTRARLQVGTNGPARIRVNGTLVGRQGEFDPYYGMARVQPYDITRELRQGVNRIEIEMADLGGPVALLVDGWVEGDGEQTAGIVSDLSWELRRNGQPVEVRLRRFSYVNGPIWATDPAHSMLRARPHPLPATDWIEAQPADDTVLPLVPDAFHGQPRVEWFRFILPPGATQMEANIGGGFAVYVDGEEIEVSGSQVELPNADRVRRVCALRVMAKPGYSGGGVFVKPLTFRVGHGKMLPGDWHENGLSAYSGGVMYVRDWNLDDVPTEERVVLNLGRVRGTAEVRVNGEAAGVRVLAPYRFELTGLMQKGENRIEVTVLNTLGPYLDAVSPTPYVFPGQLESGMIGPITLEW